MRFSKSRAIALVLAVAVGASAQFSTPSNARKSGMAGAPVSDISDVFGYGVKMLDYQDQLQATFNNGGIIGIKSVNDGFAIGLLANQGLMTDHDFGTTFSSSAVGALNGLQNAEPTPAFNEEYGLPHLLLGWNLDGFALGADVFIEYARYGSSAKSGSSASSGFGLLLDPGARVSAKFGLGGDASLLAKIGAGLPFFSGEYNPGQGANVSSVGSDVSAYLEAGAELGTPVSGVDWTFGAAYTVSTHKIKDAGNIIYSSYWNSLISLYADCGFSVLESGVAGLEYSFTRKAGTVSVGGDKQMAGEHIHSFAAGLEYVWSKAYFLDNFKLRGGLNYDITVEVASGRNDNINPPATSGSKQPGTGSALSPVMGFGASKHFLTIDLMCRMGSWNGMFMGPPIGLVTGTIKF